MKKEESEGVSFRKFERNDIMFALCYDERIKKYRPMIKSVAKNKQYLKLIAIYTSFRRMERDTIILNRRDSTKK